MILSKIPRQGKINPKRKPDLKRLKELLHYNPNTGIFIWRVSRKGTRGIGQVAGNLCKTNGYIRININGVLYRATGLQKNNKTGIRGVRHIKKTNKFRPQIKVNKINYRISKTDLDNFDEAVCYRLAAEQCLNWDYCDSLSSAFQQVQKILGEKSCQ